MSGKNARGRARRANGGEAALHCSLVEVWLLLYVRPPDPSLAPSRL